MPSEMPEGIGPTSWWQVWGEIKGEFGALRSDMQANRQRTHDLIGAVLRRQDDMRRETVFHIARIDRTLADRPAGKSGLSSWLTLKVLVNTISVSTSILGAVGLIKPEWVKLITGLMGIAAH